MTSFYICDQLFVFQFIQGEIMHARFCFGSLVFITGILVTLSSDANAGLCERYACRETADNVIGLDAKSWFLNRYDNGSAKIREVWESPSGIKATLTVDYTYNGGTRGWVEMEIRDGEVYCLRYHDFKNTCRHPR